MSLRMYVTPQLLDAGITPRILRTYASGLIVAGLRLCRFVHRILHVRST
jgi:hypothetical protein